MFKTFKKCSQICRKCPRILKISRFYKYFHEFVNKCSQIRKFPQNTKNLHNSKKCLLIRKMFAKMKRKKNK